MDLINYQPSQGEVGFNPIAVPDLVPEIEKEAARQRQADQANQRMIEMNNMQRIRNAERAGENLKALSGFSKTLTDYLQKQYKTTQDDIAIGETYDAITAGMLTEEEVAEQAGVEQEAQDVNAAATEVEEQTGDPAAGEAVRADFGQRARGEVGERAKLMSASAAYPSFMQAWMDSDAMITINGQKMTVRQALRSGDPRVIQSVIAMGRQKFFKEFELAGASKRNVVQLLGRTILTTDSQYAGTAARDAATARREADREALAGTTFDVGSNMDSGKEQVQATWDQLAKQYWLSGNFTTRREANEAALTDLLIPLVAAGDVEAIDALMDTLKTGQKGTELRKEFGKKLTEARLQAEQIADRNRSRAREDLDQAMYEELSGVSDPSERAAIIEKHVQKLRDQGYYREARELESQLQGLTIDGASARNAQLLLNQIRDGDLTDPKQIEQAALRGEITEQQRSALLTALAEKNSVETPENPAAQRIVKDYIAEFESQLLIGIGLAKDATGNIVTSDPGQTAALTPGEAQILIGAAREDLNKIANAIIQDNPGISQAQLEMMLRQAMGQWKADNVTKKEGKFGAVGQLAELADLNKTGIDRIPPDLRQQLKDLANSPVRLTNFNFDTSQTSLGGPKDLSGINFTLTDANKDQYNPLRGDKLFTVERMQEFVDLYEEGKLHPQIIAYADTLGVSPLSLMQQQLSALGMEPMRAPAIGRNPDSSNVTVTDVTSAVEGAQVFMQMGVPARGAAWLSGNIQQESGWAGQQTPWDDVGAPAGGIVSWRADRLQRIERELGRPVEQISDVEQMRYMLQEMKDQYPEAYAVFMNPNATDRQLMRASMAFWGYGEEGRRFTYARETLEQLNNSSTTEASTTNYTTGSNTGIQVTSASDASGEPGSDFVISNGQRGAKFHFPYKAEVLRVVSNQNWETRLEEGPGRRGYGNLVELRVTLPNGMKADVLIAHFDAVNGEIKVGDVIPPGTYIGTQGRTGSTTGAHISMDWYQPNGTAQPNLPARNWFLNNYLYQ